jgi:hypothetical protein
MHKTSRREVYNPECEDNSDKDHDLFELLCYSDQPEAAKKSIELLFRYFAVKDKDGNAYNTLHLCENFDKERTLEIIEKQFDHYFDSLNFTPFNTPGSVKPYRKLAPEDTTYFTMLYRGASYLSKKRGLDIATNFFAITKDWQFIRTDFQEAQLFFLEKCFQDKKMTQEQKRSFLKQTSITDHFLNKYSVSDCKLRYMRVVLQAYPDAKIPRDEFQHLKLYNILPYSFPWKTEKFREAATQRATIQVEKQEIEAILDDLHHIADKFNFERPLRKNWTMYHLTKKYVEERGVHSYILDLMFNNCISTSFETKFRHNNYVGLYEDAFFTPLKQINIRDIRISEQFVKTETGVVSKMYVKNGKTVYFQSYVDSNWKYYDGQRLVKMLNLCLKERGVPQRFIQTSFADDCSVFILEEPQKLVPLFNKYNIWSWALNLNNNFQNINYFC